MRNIRKVARAGRAATGKSAIPAAARSLAATLLIDITSPPTDLECIAGRLGATLHEEEIRGAGELRRDGDSYRIIYNPDQPIAQRRFTIAHEIAHLSLAGSNNHTHSPNDVERLCDLIAAELLFPEAIFRSAFPGEWTIEAFFALARQFQASLTATAHRCADLADLTIFEVNSGDIRWVYGPLRGTIALQDDALVQVIKTARSGAAGCSELYLNDGSYIRRWKAHYQSLGKADRTLFLLADGTVINRNA
jgi:hypothetical protein